MQATYDTTRALTYAELDDAFLQLRRLWSSRRQGLVIDADGPVDMSLLLVLEACARGQTTGAEVTILEVARFAEVAHSTASRMVDRASSTGLVEKRPSAMSGRSTALVLTPEGQALRERSMQARLAWLHQHLGVWPGQDVEELTRLLRAFLERLDTPGAQQPHRSAVGTDPRRQ